MFSGIESLRCSRRCLQPTSLTLAVTKDYSTRLIKKELKKKKKSSTAVSIKIIDVAQVLTKKKRIKGKKRSPSQAQNVSADWVRMRIKLSETSKKLLIK